MKLIIGLGNPGQTYSNTPHNLGFLTLENFLNNSKKDLGGFSFKKNLNAEIAVGKINTEKLILAKPQNYMNNSGEAVAKIIKYYKIRLSDLLVVHDDIDLQMGKIKLVFDSSSGGHNGVRSIIASLKNQKFYRLKIGVCPDKKPTKVADYLLNPISGRLKKNLNAILNTSSIIIEEFLQFKKTAIKSSQTVKIDLE